jgi:FAD/FMN-containing dehydrogenase
VIFHVGGALNERDDDDGAVGNRDARFITGFSGVWPTDDPRGDEHVAWVRDSWEAIRPFSTGGNYVNFQLAEDGAERTAGAYRRNFERLMRVKAAYDPGNLFRVNRNIPPAA